MPLANPALLLGRKSKLALLIKKKLPYGITLKTVRIQVS